jgi:Raf kinase inhibitor-like YbhB/YbcL family protein
MFVADNFFYRERQQYSGRYYETNQQRLYPLQLHSIRVTNDGMKLFSTASWTDAPEETESYALAVTDPDAVGGWNHWLVYEISKNVNEINQNSLPAGAKEVENDFGRKRYGGPSPPSGTHRYFFTLYALVVVHQ